MNVVWKPNQAASWIHLAWSASRLGEAVAPELSPLQKIAREAGPGDAPRWRAVRQAAAELDATAAQAAAPWPLVAHRAEELSDEAPASAVEPWLAKLAESARQTKPRHVEDLAVRVRPLREQWEARSPGLMRALFSLTETDDERRQAVFELSLLSPAVGGFGEALPPSDSAPRESTPKRNLLGRGMLEAMLYHPDPAFPEPVRLAWLIAQCLLTELAPETPPRRIALMALPMTLEAAAQVDWAPADLDIQHWPPAPQATPTPRQVRTWWKETRGLAIRQRLARFESRVEG